MDSEICFRCASQVSKFDRLVRNLQKFAVGDQKEYVATFVKPDRAASGNFRGVLGSVIF